MRFLPRLSIPKPEELNQYDLGLWVWSKPDRSGLPGEPLKFHDQQVFLEHYKGCWTAAAKENGECTIAGIWEEGVAGSIGRFVEAYGKYAENINPEFTPEQVTGRIWDYLRGDALAMVLTATISKDGYARLSIEERDLVRQKVGFPTRS